MSRKPWVVSSAHFAPVRSRIVLIATVVPCRNSRAARKLASAFVTPFSMPSTSRVGVVSVLPSCSTPVVSSKAATSVKVPPTSADSRIRLDSIVLKQVLREILRATRTISTAANGRNVSRRAHALRYLCAQHRHDIAGKEADRTQGFLPRQVAEGELPDEVVAQCCIELLRQETRDRGRRAGDALAALDHEVECGRTRMRLLPAVPPEQMREARVPHQIGAARKLHRFRVGQRHDDEAAEAELRKRRRGRVHLRPARAVAVYR